MKGRNIKIAQQAAQHKILILLVLTLSLIFDLIFRQPNSKSLDNQSLPEMPAAR
ncbi:hypothetical protein Xen7305DRAFT_00049380 [Xenococcus sp. PCC 7305]|uniref:hypothetical protein n=1 Tax=Xenococcus sp. PCC 7305 TaxID=102125 RepID=UPI0002ABB202|nr:hypothetical protein [Xenococcus sp. PCC 7305]ELS05195.1 hypothetical protein Xen7305DRAFT_00049380 [Xenococcus sp. PCC 7305]